MCCENPVGESYLFIINGNSVSTL